MEGSSSVTTVNCSSPRLSHGSMVLVAANGRKHHTPLLSVDASHCMGRDHAVVCTKLVIKAVMRQLTSLPNPTTTDTNHALVCQQICACLQASTYPMPDQSGLAPPPPRWEQRRTRRRLQRTKEARQEALQQELQFASFYKLLLQQHRAYLHHRKWWKGLRGNGAPPCFHLPVVTKLVQ